MSDQQIEEFLAKEPKVPVKFNHDVQGLGKYIGSTKSNNVATNQCVELPFYIAAVLFKRPAFLENKVINALQVNPLNVNLRILCPQFYTFAIKYLELYEDPDLAEILIKSKKIRGLEIFDRAKRIYEDHNEFIEKLDDGEQL
ncbi:11467_t:CDS:2, partial [Gigaspora rosea]